MEIYWGYTPEYLEKTRQSYEQTCKQFNIDPKKAAVMLKCAEILYLDVKRQNGGSVDPFEWLHKQTENNQKIDQWDHCYKTELHDEILKKVLYEDSPYIRYGHFMKQYFPPNFETEFDKTLNENNVPFTERLNKYYALF